MSLATVFPQAADIPAEFAHTGEITQREYLLNGELVQWQGELSPVVSPIYIRNSDSLQQVVLGHTPLLDGETALKALDSAVKAYDLGRGAWPTMAVLERIATDKPSFTSLARYCCSDTTGTPAIGIGLPPLLPRAVSVIPSKREASSASPKKTS